jgi:Ca-activated chloride channel family protein
MKKITSLFIVLLILSACSAISGSNGRLDIISGSENETLEPVLEKFSRETGISIHMHYKGSVDIMLELQDGDIPYDAIWPANSLWVSMGDVERKVKHERSIMSSPVVFGIKKSVAEILGFVDKEVYVKNILDAVSSGQLNFMMTSATQSNSGASAFFGFLSALSGNPNPITAEHLDKPELKNDLRKLLSGINRSSGSSGWLKSLFLESNYDAMVNYEALLIETNQELLRQGKEPLYLVYPIDGIVIADSPLGYVNNGNAKKEENFLKLQEYLLSADIQKQLSDMGRRTGLGAFAAPLNPAVFKSEWGIDPDRILSPFTMPSAKVISKALTMYQTAFRKPSLTVYCLDYSGSMSGSGENQMKSAMALLFDQTAASNYLIQTGEDDISIVLPFNSEVLGEWRVVGNDPEDLRALYVKIRSKTPDGGTDIYSPVIRGLDILARIENLQEYQPAIILLTDGESNQGAEFSDFRTRYNFLELDIPVFSIAFGAAQEKQLKEIAEHSRARVFDGKSDLISTFRKAKGYN